MQNYVHTFKESRSLARGGGPSDWHTFWLAASEDIGESGWSSSAFF